MKKIIFALLIVAAGCSSTSIINSWKAPDATYSPEQFKKVAVLAITKDEQTRKTAEDQIVSNHKALHTTYSLFSSAQLGDDTLKVKNMLKEQGFDAIIVMRLITTKSKSTYVQGGVNPAYTQNYIFYYPDYLKSGSYATDLEYIIATNFYSLTQNKLLWSGVTKSTNPEKVDKLVNEVAKEVVFKMKEDKFIPEK